MWRHSKFMFTKYFSTVRLLSSDLQVLNGKMLWSTHLRILRFSFWLSSRLQDFYKLRMLPKNKNGWSASIKDKQGLNFLWTHAFTSTLCVLSGLLRSPDKNIFGPSRARDFRESLNARNLGEIMGVWGWFWEPWSLQKSCKRLDNQNENLKEFSHFSLCFS